MNAFLLTYEPYIRLAVFAAVFTSMALCEVVSPRRSRQFGRAQRWPGNLGIVVLDTLLVRIIFPTTAVGVAMMSESVGTGLFQLVLLPLWISVPLAVIVLDFAIYLQHVLFHAGPIFWRLHRMHHSDLDFDVTTGYRFHPIEILLSMVLKLGVIIALGPPAVAVLIFEVLLNATAMFNYSNIFIPLKIDRILRWLVVTPDMHRIHHSIAVNKTNSNFGFNLPWWDRLLGTYRDQPNLGHQGMTIGIEQFRNPAELRVNRMLSQPFREEDKKYSFSKKRAP